jgi:hypothetical protein
MLRTDGPLACVHPHQQVEPVSHDREQDKDVVKNLVAR